MNREGIFHLNRTAVYITSEMELTFSKGSVRLNNEQYRVVIRPPNENQRILASAGSGKTTTITSRIAYLVEEYGMDPSRILLVSFSRSAAQEMIHRVHKLIGPVALYAGTFHGLSAQLLREQSPATLLDQPFIDELPYRLVAWLESDKGRRWAARFRTIIVDEFQDINEIQWRILHAIYRAANRLSSITKPLAEEYTASANGLNSRGATMTIVGDDAQNIYTWRGSSVDFILNFHKQLPYVKDYQLCMNYRSTEAIVTIANSVMRFIPTLPFKEKMVAHRKGGQTPEVHFFFRGSDECDWIVNSIERIIRSEHTHTQAQKPTIAVLSRYNADLFKIEERLHKKGLPYQLCTQYSPDQDKTMTHQITLATLHASKGLEWDAVFFMNLHDDVFPSRKSDEDIICERRLFYVGITRAKHALYLTYSRSEKSLSRFVREIPRPFLRFHNVASFQLSKNDPTDSIMSLDDMLRGLDGADWNELRQKKHVPQISQRSTSALYRFGELFPIPEWVKRNDVRHTWYELLRLTTLRECALHHGQLTQLTNPVIRSTLLTLRIYREDWEFWEQYETELEHLVRRFLSHTAQMPAVEFSKINKYVASKMPHLTWSDQDTCKAAVILGKIRGQLRPMRHAGFDLDEFTFGVVRHSVPTELRPDLMASWHAVLNPTRKSHEIQGDLWRIAALQSVDEGRNIPLYQHAVIAPLLEQEEHQAIVRAMETALPIWSATLEGPTFENMLEVEGMRAISFDIMTERCAYNVFFDPSYVPSNEDKILLLLKQYAYEETFDRALDSVGFLNVATGMLLEFEVTPLIREQLSEMWSALQSKFRETLRPSVLPPPCPLHRYSSE